nr:hypothetical protein BaRGS_025937 [Batillaria attramentaria]
MVVAIVLWDFTSVFTLVVATTTTTTTTDSSGKSTTPYTALRRELRSRDDVVTSTGGIHFNWTNPALAWDNSASGPYSNLTVVQIPLDEIWTPLAFIGNGASNDRELDLGKSAFVSPDGSVFVMKSLILETTCNMDLHKYPFDQQECRVAVAMYSSVPIDCRSAESEIFSDEVGKQLFGVSAEWTLTSMRLERVEVTTMPGAFFLNYFLVIKRKTTFFVVSFIIPVVMTSYMNTLVFLIPADSGEKISYVVSIFVSNAVFLSFCTNVMPEGLDSTPLVMYLVLGIMSQSGILIMVNSLILRKGGLAEKLRERDLPSNVVEPQGNEAEKSPAQLQNTPRRGN